MNNYLGSEEQKFVPAEASFWVFIIGEMFLFGAMYFIFMSNRFWSPEHLLVFEAGQKALNQAYGALNTGLLLTSSWFMVLGLKAAREGQGEVGKSFMKLTLLCGAGFVCVKFFEYSEKVQSGLTLNTDAFFKIFYMYTTLHLMHVLVGMVVILYLIKHCFKKECQSPDNIKIIEGGACFWHLVDLLWIGIFTLIYLVG